MFHEDSAVPEHKIGHNEILAQQNGAPESTPSPSVETTDRYGLEAAGKGYLLRRYNVETSAAGNPYFVPIPSILKSLQADAELVLTLARRRIASDIDKLGKIEPIIESAGAYFHNLIDHAGEGREWVARKRVIWPMTDDLGYQLYKAAAGIDDLADFGAYLVRNDANIESIADAQDDDRYQKREFWSNLALDEAGELDMIIQEIEETDYNLDMMVSQGYRNQARLDTKTHLQGVRTNVPVTEESAGVKGDLKAQLMAAAV